MFCNNNESKYNRNYEKKENSFDYSQVKGELNEIWKEFMSSFSYNKFYHLEKIKKINEEKIVSDSYIIEGINENLNRSLSIKKLNKFFQKNYINILDNKALYIQIDTKNKDITELLTEAKLWIMYIIITLDQFDNNINESICIENKINLVINLFYEAIKNRCDLISIFEFFLIYVSSLSQEDYNVLLSSQMMKIIPKDFLILYSQKKTLLKSIFEKNSGNYSKNEEMDFADYETNLNSEPINFDLEKDFNKFIEKEREQESKDGHGYINFGNNKELKIINKDYMSKGFFALFEDNSFNEENNYDYILMPLKEHYNTYDEKIEAEKTLENINNSEYKDYFYYPYNKLFVSQII